MTFQSHDFSGDIFRFFWGYKLTGLILDVVFGGATLPTTIIFASENGCLEDEISFGMAYFEVRTVSFREGKIKNSIVVPHQAKSYPFGRERVPLDSKIPKILRVKKDMFHLKQFGWWKFLGIKASEQTVEFANIYIYLHICPFVFGVATITFIRAWNDYILNVSLWCLYGGQLYKQMLNNRS